MGRPGKPAGLCRPDPSRRGGRGRAGTLFRRVRSGLGGARSSVGVRPVLSLVHAHVIPPPRARGSHVRPSPANPKAHACVLPGRPPSARRRPDPPDLLELLPGRRSQILPHRDFRASSSEGRNPWAGLRRASAPCPASPRPPGTLSGGVGVKTGAAAEPRVSPVCRNPFAGAEVGCGPVAGGRSCSRWSTPPGDAPRSREASCLGGSSGRPSPAIPQAHACGLPGRPPSARRRPNPPDLLELFPGRRSQIRPHRDFRAHAFQWVDLGVLLLTCTREPLASRRPTGNLPCTRDSCGSPKAPPTSPRVESCAYGGSTGRFPTGVFLPGRPGDPKASSP